MQAKQGLKDKQEERYVDFSCTVFIFFLGTGLAPESLEVTHGTHDGVVLEFSLLHMKLLRASCRYFYVIDVDKEIRLIPTFKFISGWVTC